MVSELLTPQHLTELFASLVTIVALYAYGNKWVYAPVVAMLGELVWWVLCVAFGLWGLIPACAVATVVHLRNFLKWRREEPVGDIEDYIVNITPMETPFAKSLYPTPHRAKTLRPRKRRGKRDERP